MKTVFVLLVLLCTTRLCYTQDTSKIPTLPIWYEAQGISKVSFLENFDVANGGNNAIAINKNCGETWYLGNGKVDTNNKFCWGRGYWVAKVDFNGDGIADYIDDNRNIFQGEQKDSPPQTKPVATYQAFQMPVPGRQNRYFVDDFNNDGKEDIIVPGLYNLAKILLGNSDVNKMQVATLPTIQNTAYSLQYVVGAWKDTDGKNKIVLYQQTDTNYAIRTEAYFLYEFKINNDLTVEYTALDTTSFKDFKDKLTPSYLYASSFVWHSKDNSMHTLIAPYGASDIYAISLNKMKYKWSKLRREGSGMFLSCGKVDTTENMYFRGANPNVLIYKGNPVIDTNAKVKIPIFYKGIPYESIAYLGDINNDGYGELAVVYGTQTSWLVIYNGIDASTGITDNSIVDRISININQPCSRLGTLKLTITSIQYAPIHLILYDLQGKKIADFGLQQVDSNDSLIIDLHQLNITSGIYNLRFTVDKQVIDKALIITE